MPAPSPPPVPPSRWPIPRGTVTLIVGRLADNGHTRGGKRMHVGRVLPERLDALLAGQEPGRFRVSCLNAGGQFIRGGAYAVEIGPESPLPRIVPARTSRDYGTRTPLSAARRKERAALERVETLRRQIRQLGAENVRLRHEASRSESARLQEQLRVGTERDRVADELARLAQEQLDLRGEMARRDQALRHEIETLRTELAARSGPPSVGVDEVVTSLPAMFSETDIGEIERETWRPEGVATSVTSDVSSIDRRSQGRPSGEDGASRALAALATVRNVSGSPPSSRRSASVEPTARSGHADQLDRFLRQKPPHRK